MNLSTQPLDGASTSSSTSLSAENREASKRRISSEDEESLKTRKEQQPSINVSACVGTAYKSNIGIGTQNNYENCTFLNGERKNDPIKIPQNDEHLLKSILQKTALRISLNPIETSMKLQNLEDSIEPVPIELKSGAATYKLDEEDHNKWPKDFEKTMTTCKGNILLEEIFSKAKKYAIIAANQNVSNKGITVEQHKEAIDAYIQRHGNIVAITGHAGMGKSTLAKQIIQLVCTKKLFPEINYIFFVEFRRVNFKEKCSLLKLLLTGTNDWTYSADFDYLWLEKLHNNPNVIIVFDGLDEAGGNFLSGRLKQCYINEKCYPGNFSKNIFAGNILPLAKKVVTSRPRQLADLHRECKPLFEVHIAGLNSSSQNKLGQQICKENYRSVRQFLDDYPDVLASCFVPVNCIIIMIVLSLNARGEKTISIDSLTEIFVDALHHCVESDHIRNERIEANFKKEMTKLAFLAWKGFLDIKLIFTEEDVEEAGIAENVFQAFLHTFKCESNNATFKLLEGSSFSHFIWQELFAALYVVFILSLSDFKTLLDKLTESWWEMVSKFIFGLFCPYVERKVKSLFLLDKTQKRDLKEKKKLLFDYTVNLMKEVPFEKSPHPTLNFLRLCSWIKEAQCEELNDCIAPILPKEIKVGERLLPIDVTGLAYVLQIAKKPFSSKIEPLTDFRLNSQEIFLKGLAKSNVKNNKLNCDQMKFQPKNLQILANSFENLGVLKLEKCALSSEDAKVIGNKLASLKEQMQQLSLRFNKIGDEGAKGIAIGLNKLMALNLCDCEIGPSGAIAIGEKLKSLAYRKIELDLSENMIEDDGILAIAEGLRNIKSLNVSYCDITCKGAAAIGRNLESLSQPMKELNLRGNFIGDDGAKSIAEGIRNIEHIVLNCCNISTDEANAIKKKLKDLSTKVTGDDFSSDDYTTDSEED